MTTPPSLTLFFIVEPPSYQYLACYLAASIRNHLPADVELVGYCPAHRMSEVDPNVIETLRRMRCDVRSFSAENRFDPAYPHGNKLLACLEPRSTAFSGFVDSDVLFLQDNQIGNLISDGCVSASVAASMYWARQTIWDTIYSAFDMEIPDDRVTLMRDRRKPMIPYYSSGFVTFPEQYRTPEGLSFPQVWMETAQTIDGIEGLENKRPYLDQMSLPLAIQRAGLTWRELPEEQHFILGGQMRGQGLPADRKIYTVHYRKWDVLKESGLSEQGYDELRKQVGTRRVSWIGKQPLPAGIPPLKDAAVAPASPAPALAPTAPAKGPDPSRADVAAVTMVHQDYAFLARWIEYYARHLGRENLYVLRHGDDAEIDRIAAGTNIVHVPNPEDKSGFDRRRWVALSKFASGLTLYYNWVICGDVDEIIAVDPAVSDRLKDYLLDKLREPVTPRAISPFAVEIVHTPATEPEALAPDAPLLSRRRNFRLNSNYAKPCMIRNRIEFSVGGHGSNLADVALDPHLYLFHLRYMDNDLSRERLEQRRRWMAEKNGDPEDTGRRKSTWDQGDEAFNILSKQAPVAEVIDFPEFREQMVEGRSQAATGNWFFKNMRSKELYRLPERFTQLF